METKSNLNKHEKTIISWIAPEYIKHEKTKMWYIIALIIAILSVIYSFFTGNWSMGLVIITFAIIYIYIQEYHPPKNIEIKITDLGIHIGSMFIQYQQIKAFWIIYKEHHKSLNLLVTGKTYPEIKIQLNQQSPVEVRNYLLTQIPEIEGKDETFSDVLVRLLKL